jgi:intracellular multiplication protein IcmD
MNTNTKNFLRNFSKVILVSSLCAFSVELLAAGAGGAGGGGGDQEGAGLGKLANNLRGQFKDIANLILATAKVAGIGFTVAAIFKFKQHKDNPQQVPIGTPFSLLAVGVILMFLQNLYTPAAQSIYGGKAQFESGFDVLGGQGGGQVGN